MKLNYGREGLSVRLPENAQTTILRKPAMPVIKDPRAGIEAAIGDPIDAPKLSEIAQDCRSVCIAICDITRPVPNHLFLRPLIEACEAAGIERSNICIVIATGLHRPNEGEELAELIGNAWVLENIAIHNHFALNDDEHISLGKTNTRGTAIRLDRRFVEADLRIATGLVEPHFMAGYSGGRKVVAPGLAHAETITTFHSARFMADPASRNCNIDGNPLHEEQLEIIRALDSWDNNSSSRYPKTLGLNTVLDDERRLAFVTFGDIFESHFKAVDFSRSYCELEVESRFDIVLTTAAGYPLDKTYYQTVKGMVGAMEILAPGGDLVIASQCEEGLGSADYEDAQKRLIAMGPNAFLDSLLKKSHADIDEWQTQMQLKPQAVGNIHLFSEGLSAAGHELTGVHRISNLELELQQLVDKQPDTRLAVIPEGPYVVPRMLAPQIQSS
ncbi:MAG: nickel-dependent lactate racemase [Planctomycetota bacterium]